MSFKHWIKKWKAVGDIMGITGSVNSEEKSLGDSAKDAYTHQVKSEERKDDDPAHIAEGAVESAGRGSVQGGEDGDDE